MRPIAEKAMKPFISSPGAKTKGKRAQMPISSEVRPEATAVAKRTAPASKPPLLSIAGLTTRMYAKLK
jgi:hypothetical protein